MAAHKKNLSDPKIVDDIFLALEQNMTDYKLNSPLPTTNRLFISCPRDGIESYIQKHFKGNNFCLSLLGLSLPIQDTDFQERLYQMISLYEIEEIYLIQRIDNQIIKQILQKKKQASYPSEIQIEELLIEHYAQLKSAKNQQQQLAQLCALQIETQAKNIASLLTEYKFGRINIRGFLFEAHKNQFTELDLQNQAKRQIK
jgi:primosomal replication protein N